MYLTRTVREFGRAIGAGVFAVLMSSGAALAQQGVPAETPPASYTGDQYTDSRGCIFVRAGIGGNTSWVPRVGRDRQQLCGFSPTGVAATQTVAAPAPAERPGVVIIGGTASTGAAAASEPRAPSAAETRTTPGAATPSTPAIRSVRATSPTVRTAPTPPRAVATPAAPVETGGCLNLPADMRPYFNGPDPRCGPQAIHPGDVARGLESVRAVTVPDGYRLAWTDDRLNPHRGQGTPAGEAAMRRIWTDDVPMALATPTTRGVVREPTASTRSVTTRGRPQAPEQALPAAPATAQVRVAADHRHVLAATYESRAEADRAYARLSASGVPTRLGQINRSTGMVYAVVAGPFATPQDLVSGLQATRAAGFSGAVTRR